LWQIIGSINSNKGDITLHSIYLPPNGQILPQYTEKDKWASKTKDIEILDQIIKTFGRFSGPVLEHITHLEDIFAKGNLHPTDRSTNVINKPSKTYFNRVVIMLLLQTCMFLKNHDIL
jgi:hypothetical protein